MTGERVIRYECLLSNLSLIDKNTWQTSQEVYSDAQKGAFVGEVTTSNMGIYRLVNGKAVFDLLGREGHLFIDDKFKEDAYKGINENKFFFLTREMNRHVMSVINAGASTTVPYSGLNVEAAEGTTFGSISTSNQNTDEEKKLFSAIFGTDNCGNTKIVSLLTEDVVKAQLKKRRDDLIARTCYFHDNFYENNNLIFFYATGNGDEQGVRGVLNTAAVEMICKEEARAERMYGKPTNKSEAWKQDKGFY